MQEEKHTAEKVVDELTLALKESEERYRKLVELSPYSIITLNNNKFAFVNQAGLKLFKAKAMDQLMGKNFMEFISKDHVEKIMEMFNLAQSNNQIPILWEETINSLDGTSLDVEMTIGQIDYLNMKMIHIIMRDMTEQNHLKLEKEIQRSIIRDLMPSNSVPNATASILETICEKLLIDVGMLWVLDEKQNLLRCINCWQNDKILGTTFIQYSQNATLGIGDGLVGIAWRDGKVIWTDNIGTSYTTPVAGYAADCGIEQAVAFPLFSENKVNIIIELLGNRLKTYDQNLIRILSKVGDQLEVFLRGKEVQGQMTILMERDLVTGFYNRPFLENLIANKIATLQNHPDKIAFLLVGIDGFMVVNETIGHKGGDTVLKIIAERIDSVLLRSSILARIEGDKYVIALFDASVEQIVALTQKLQGIFISPIIYGNSTFALTASIGISIYPEDGVDIQTLLENCDMAMKQSKGESKNNFRFYNAEMGVLAKRRITLEQYLQKALENQEFTVYYQPKLDIKTKKIIGVEALLRWQRPDEMIMPAEFIPIAENTGIIVQLGAWVLRTACEQVKAWHNLGMTSLSISVNLSMRQFKDPDLIKQVANILNETAFDPQFLELELTESVLMQNTQDDIKTLTAFKNMGIAISIDDFGTGFSSFSYLKLRAVDAIKIDKSFVQEMDQPHIEDIVAAIISMSKKLKLRTIAEGVETEQQLTKLKSMDCDEVQGYLFAKPLAVADMTKLLYESASGSDLIVGDKT